MLNNYTGKLPKNNEFFAGSDLRVIHNLQYSKTVLNIRVSGNTGLYYYKFIVHK